MPEIVTAPSIMTSVSVRGAVPGGPPGTSVEGGPGQRSTGISLSAEAEAPVRWVGPGDRTPGGRVRGHNARSWGRTFAQLLPKFRGNGPEPSAGLLRALRTHFGCFATHRGGAPLTLGIAEVGAISTSRRGPPRRAVTRSGATIGNMPIRRGLEELRKYMPFPTESEAEKAFTIIVQRIDIELSTSGNRPGRDLVSQVRRRVGALSRVRVTEDPDRLPGQRYYSQACFKVDVTAGNESFEVCDGGFTDWTERLLDDRRERLLISAAGLDRLALALQG